MFEGLELKKAEVEKKGIGKAKIGLVVLVALIVILLISNVLFYVKMTDLQSDLNSALETKVSLQNTVENLQQEIENLKQPDFYTVQLEWSVYEESEGQFRIEVEGVVFNAGEYGATYVVAYPSFKTGPHSYLFGITPVNFTISHYFVNGAFEGKTFREFSQTFYTDNWGVWDIIETTIMYEYSTTV